MAVTGGAIAIVLLVLGGWSASRAIGTPIPSLLVDPFGDFSVVFLPGWGTAELGLQPGDRVVAVAGHALQGAALHGQLLAAAVEEAARAGDDSVELELRRGGEVLRVRPPIRRIGADEIFWFFVLYALMGGLLLWSGVAALRVAGRRPGARAYLAMSASGFVFLVTFFDYHTTRLLAPLFAASTFGTAVALLAVALFFPEPPRLGRLGWRAVGVGFALGLGVTLVVSAGPLFGLDLPRLRQAAAVAVSLSLVALGVSVLLRLWRAKDHARRELRSAALGLVLLPLLVATAHVVVRAFGFAAFHMVLPFVALLIPASVGYALIRHNILATTAVLTRRLLLPPLVFVAAATGGIAWWVSWETARLYTLYPTSVLLGAVVAAGVVLGGWQALTRLLFPAAGRFRPTVLQLADRLAALTEASAVRDELAACASRCLSGARVEAKPRAALSDELGLSLAAIGQLEQGDEVWGDGDPWQRRLFVPLRSAGQLLGVLVVPPKESGAPLSDDELTLLRTIAGLGALALHNIEVVRALDARRAIEVDATREDKRLAVDLIAAEMAHELSYPLTYFRHFLRQLAQGREPKSGDVEIGQEEVARLERMLASMRKLQIPAPTLQNVSARNVTEKAATLLASDLEASSVTVELDVPADLVLRADPDQLLQLLANLLRNGAQAAGTGGRIGVSVRTEGGQPVLEVWDTGPGVPEAERDAIFRPWTTNRQDGTGLGLALSLRIARGFGWVIEVGRRDGRTYFSLVPRPGPSPATHGT